MKEKVKCKVCHLKIDKDLDICPFCGAKQSEVIEEKKEIIVDDKKETKNKPLEFIARSKALSFSNIKHTVLILIGTIGLTFAQLIFQGIVLSAGGQDFLNSSEGLGIAVFCAYALVFLGFVLFLFRDNIKIFKLFISEYKTYLFGLCFGILLLITSIILNLIISRFGFVQNENQNSALELVATFPFLSFIVLGIIGPVVEELTYRVGLFGLIRKYNRLASFLVTALLFALIHFDFSSVSTASSLANELINIPSYFISGIILCFAYEKYGISGCIIAHMFNNCIAVISYIII